MAKQTYKVECASAVSEQGVVEGWILAARQDVRIRPDMAAAEIEARGLTQSQAQTTWLRLSRDNFARVVRESDGAVVTENVRA